MTDDNGAVVGSIGSPNEEEETVRHAPNAVGPNIEFAIAPVGLIRVAFAQSIVMSAFYCDSEAARIISTQFAEMADKLDAAHEQLRELQEFAVTDTVEEDDSIQEAEIVPEPLVTAVPEEQSEV